MNIIEKGSVASYPRRKHIVYGIVTSISIACSLTACAAPRIYSPNSALVRIYEEVRADEPFPAPYMSVYRNGKKELRFIAAMHGADPGTFSLIRNAFARPPDILIIEGQDSGAGFSPPPVIRTMDEMALYGKAEPFYAANLALRHKVPFLGGEPPRRELLAAVLAAGFSVKDFQGQQTLSALIGGPGYTSDREPNFDDLKKDFQRKFSIGDLSLLMKDEEEFHSWYAKQYGRTFNMKELAQYRGQRFIGPVSGFDWRIENVRSDFRNAYLARVIADMLNTHDNVLVVFGAGHRMELAAVLEDMLGKPVSTQPERAKRRNNPLPLTERLIIDGRFENRPGIVLQSARSNRDFFIEKRGERFCVTQYLFTQVFHDDNLVAESCFGSVLEVNDHLGSYFR